MHTCPSLFKRIKSWLCANGYRLLGEFVLPAVCWWENYYVPLAECLGRFRERHAGNPGAFGYVFFIMQRQDNGVAN